MKGDNCCIFSPLFIIPTDAFILTISRLRLKLLTMCDDCDTFIYVVVLFLIIMKIDLSELQVSDKSHIALENTFKELLRDYFTSDNLCEYQIIAKCTSEETFYIILTQYFKNNHNLPSAEYLLGFKMLSEYLTACKFSLNTFSVSQQQYLVYQGIVSQAVNEYFTNVFQKTGSTGSLMNEDFSRILMIAFGCLYNDDQVNIASKMQMSSHDFFELHTNFLTLIVEGVVEALKAYKLSDSIASSLKVK